MAKIKKIKLGTTTYDLCDADALHSHQTIKQDGITGATVNRFGTCSTAAATAAKTASITNGTFNLEAGAKVTVKFSSKNTASTPTLNINNTGAKNIYYKGSQITSGSNKGLLEGVVEFVYDGTQWQLIGPDASHTPTVSATNTTTALTGGTGTANTKISTGANTGDLYVPVATASTPGTTIVYPSTSCTTFSSEAGTITPAAAQKAAKQFAITRPESEENTIPRFTNTTGDVESTGIKIESVTNTKDSTKKAQVLSIPAEGGKKMVYGYCTDQTDGTSFIGGVFAEDVTEFPYDSGLAIGGTSGNLLWKGKRVLDTTDLTEATTSKAGLMSAADKSNLSAIVTSFTSDDSDTTIDTVKEVLKAFENSPEGTNIANTFASKSDKGHVHEVVVQGTTGTNSGTTVTALTGVKVSASSSAAPGGHKHNYDKTTGVSLTANTSTATDRIKYVESISGSKPTLGGTTTFVTGVTEGSGHLESYDAETDGNKITNDGTRIKYVDSIGTGSVSGTGAGSAAPQGHTHTYNTYSLSGSNSSHSKKYMKATTTPASTGTVGISGGSGSLTSDTTATNGIKYVQEISNTAASASGTAKAGSETHTHTYDKATGISLGSNDTASGGTQYIQDVTHSPASLTGTKTFNTDAIKSVTLSASDVASDGPEYVQSVTHTPASLTGTKTFNTDAIKSVTLSESTTSTDGPQYIKSISGGSGSLASYDAASGGTVKTANGTRIPYIHDVTHTPASLTGDTTFVKSVSGGSGSLTSDSTSTNGIAYIASASHTAASLGDPSTSSAAPSGHTHSYDKVTGVNLTVNSSNVTGSAQYVESISGTAPSLTGTTTFVKSVSGGSGSLKSYNAVTNGTPITESGRIQYVHSLSKGYTPAGSITLTAGTAPTFNADTGLATDIPYVASISGGSAVSKTTRYMKFSAGTTPPSGASFSGTAGTTGASSGSTGTAQPTFTGSAVTSGAASTTTTSSAGANTTTTSNTGKTTPTFTGSAVTSGAASTTTTSSAGGGTASQNTGATTPTFTGSAVTSGAASTSTTSASSSLLTGVSVTDGVLSFSSGTHTHTMAHTHSVTAAGSVGSHTHTYTKPAAHTHTLSHTHSVTAAGTVSEHDHTYYAPAAHTHTLSHTHSVTAAGTVSSHSHSLNSHTHSFTPAGTVTFTAGTAPSMNFNTGSSSDTAYIATVSGGSAVTPVVKYMQFTPGTTPPSSASFSGTKNENVVTGGTTYYLDHTHTAASGSSASVGISGGSYSATKKYLSASPSIEPATTGQNSGTNFSAVTGYPSFSGGSASHNTKYLHHTHTGASGSTGTVGISGGDISKTTYYLAHGHTAASGTTRYMKAIGTAASTGTVGINGGGVNPVTQYMKVNTEAASTGTVGISGGSISKTTKYFHPSISTTSTTSGTPSATTTFVTGVTGGTTTATTKYLHHTHNAASLTGTTTFNTDAIKAVTLSASTTSTDGPVYVDSVTNSSLSLSSVSGTTGANSGTAVSTISGVSYTAPTVDTRYLDHEHVASTASGTGTVTISGGSYSATTRYLSAAPTNTSTETTENSGTNFNAATAVAANGTASVAPSGHTHSYGSAEALTTSSDASAD